MAALAALLLAAMYAAALALVLFASSENGLLARLDLAAYRPGGRAALWCVTMMSALLLASYFFGAASLRWYRQALVAGWLRK